MPRRKVFRILSDAFCLVFFWLCAFCFAANLHAQIQTITKIEAGKPIERGFADGAEKHSFEIELAAGQYCDVLIEQKGVDVTANLLGADGKQIAQFDYDPRPQGSERIEFIAPNAARYKIVVAPKYKVIFAGKYRINSGEPRAGGEKDRRAQEIRDAFAESVRLQQARKFDEAVAAISRARGALEGALDANSLFYGIILRRAGLIFFDQGDYAEAEKNLVRSAEILGKLLEKGDPRTSETLNNLAVLYNIIGKYERAAQIFEEILFAQEKVFGENHPLVTAVLNNYGNLSRRTGNYGKAETLHLRSLAIREKLFGTDAPEVNSALSGLSTVYYEKKDYEKARLIDERALRIGEKNLAPDDPKLATALTNVALVYTELGEYEKAETMLLRSLSILEKAFGADSVNLTNELNNLGKLFAHQGNYAKSDEVYRRGLKIMEKNLPPDNPRTANTVGNIAANLFFQGKFAEAEPLLQKQLAMREKSLGKEHPDAARTLNTLARIYENSGNAERAAEYQIRANNLVEKHIGLNLYGGSEVQQLAFFDYLAEQTDQIISMQNRFAENKTLRDLGATTVLQRKGRVQDIFADNLNALRRRFNSKDQKLLGDLSETNSQLAKTVTAGMNKQSAAEREKQSAVLSEKKENLEAEISRLSAGFYEQKTALTLQSVRTEIPPDAVLLEYVVYHPFTAQARNPAAQYGKARYGIYLIRAQGDVEFRDLGEAAEIERAIRVFREAVRDPKRKDTAEFSRALYEKIVKPVRILFGSAARLLISPDGELNLIPFEALADEKDGYLIEKFSVNYLTSGRDLLRMKTTRESKGAFLLIANPQFGEPAADTEKTSIAGNNRRSVTATRDLTETFFAPLGGTAREAEAIKRLFPGAAFLTAAEATETALKQTAAPRLLHIATHGFFLENAENERTSVSATRRAVIDAQIRNPLLRSGLALAGANRRSADKASDDGILTALEGSALNLWGTKLVVLSACDTGLGEIKNGEGVYGLRRAFILAGTESLVMSLWSVSDAATRDLMTEYYKNLKQGAGRGASLRQVQLKMLKTENRRHPFYWASFIQSGEWANLDGKR